MGRGLVEGGGNVGDGREEMLGVGVFGVGKDLFSIAALNDFAVVHDDEAVTDGADDGEVVGNEKNGEVAPRAEVGEEIEDAGLHGDVEGGDRFVGNEDAGIHCEGAGNGDALALAAGEFGGVGVHDFCGEAHLVEEFGDALGAVGLRAEVVDGEDFGDGVTDGFARIEGTDRVLEDHLDGTTRHGFEVGRTTGDGEEPAEGFGDGAFAATALADNPKELILSDIKADALHRTERRLPRALILNYELINFQNCIHLYFLSINSTLHTPHSTLQRSLYSMDWMRVAGPWV